MEDKTGLVVLDRLKASDQVRVVLNNQKRVCVYSDQNCISSHFCISVILHTKGNETFVPHEDHFELDVSHKLVFPL